ncbi:sensor histidine kinase [Streptoverticillium reticulum]|uniref:sensor histidine kinase n=1 Tax=Streptoverticillium reticulum TaxID=1433415 RepID=UPI0039BF04DE
MDFTARGDSASRPTRRWRPSPTDVALALAAAAYGVGDSLVHPASGLLTGRPEWAALVAGLVGLLVLWRRRFTRSVSAVVLVAHVLCYAPGALAVMIYTLAGLYRRPAQLAAVGLSALAAETAASELAGAGPDLVHGVPFVAAPLVMGLYVATRQRLIDTMRERAAALESRQALLEGRAKAEERTRIARELHDVVGHRVSHVVLAAGALQVGAGRGAEWVREEAEHIRSAGVQALVELRDILGVLTYPERGGTAPMEPTPTVADLDALVADCRRLGMDITLDRRGPLDALPAATQLAVYRVLQEAFTNALRHAPGAAVTAEVTNDGPAVRILVANGVATESPADDLPSAGHGLLGLAERLRLLGGTFEAGPRRDGGFRVRAGIPHDPARTEPSGPHAPPESSLDQSHDRR